MKFVWNGKNKRLLFCLLFAALLLFGGCDDSPARSGEGFYSYPGYRDFWRIPLLYPYQILIVDSFETGNFEKYDPSTRIAEGRGELLISQITAFAECGKYWFFKDGKSYFSFCIPAEKKQKFLSKKEFVIFLKEQNLPSPVWKNLDTLYKEKWEITDKTAENLSRKFLYQRQNHYGIRIPLKMPWQIVIPPDKKAFIGKYDISQAVSDLLPPQGNKKWVENISFINCSKNFTVFKQINSATPYGCLIYASGSVCNFKTKKELADFIKRNYPDTQLPEMMDLEKFYSMVWAKIKK